MDRRNFKTPRSQTRAAALSDYFIFATTLFYKNKQHPQVLNLKVVNYGSLGILLDEFYFTVLAAWEQPELLNLQIVNLNACLDTLAPILWKFPRKAPRISQPAGPTHIEEEERRRRKKKSDFVARLSLPLMRSELRRQRR